MTTTADGRARLDALAFRAVATSDPWSGRVVVSSTAALELLREAGLSGHDSRSIASRSLVELLRRIVGRERGRSPQDVVALLRLAVAADGRGAEIHIAPSVRS